MPSDWCEDGNAWRLFKRSSGGRSGYASRRYLSVILTFVSCLIPSRPSARALLSYRAVSRGRSLPTGGRGKFKIGAESCRKRVSSLVEIVTKPLHIFHQFLYRFSQVLKHELASRQVRDIFRNCPDVLCIDVELL